MAPLEVIVVGAGFGGLSAAIECRLRGMKVTLIERYVDSNTRGDIIDFFVNGGLVISRWDDGKVGQEILSIGCESDVLEMYKYDSELLYPVPWFMKDEDRAKTFAAHRGKQHGIVMAYARRLGVQIELGKSIVDYKESEEHNQAGSIFARKAVLGLENEEEKSGWAIFRSYFTASEKALAHPELKNFFRNGEDVIKAWAYDNLSILAYITGIASGTTSTVALAILALAFYLWTTKGSAMQHLPPAPKGYPFLGNPIDVVRAGGLLHLKMIALAREHGEIIRFVLGPNTEYVINSDRACAAIFQKNAAISSERPAWLVGQKYITNYESMDLLDASNPRWKLQWKIALQNLTSVQRADAGLPYLYHETLKFLRQVAQDPNAGAEKQTNLWDSIGRYVYSTFTSQLYGLEITTISGFYIADIFTALDYLPLALKPWAKNGIKRHKPDVEFVQKRMNYAKRLVNSGSSPDSFMTRVLTSSDKSGASETEAAYVALKLIAAASDTSRVSTWVFLEQMMMNPRVQLHARNLIDDAIGDRLPVWEDIEQTSYVRYLMKETWRMRPPVGNALAHRITADTAYEDYVIPAGSTVRPNIWAIGRDPKRHPDPDTFRPERWEGDELSTQQSANLPYATQRDHFAFGVGRRFCPGVQVAERSFAVAIMRTVWAYEIGVRPGTPLPLNPDDYMEKELPGVPGSRLPLSLKVRPERKSLIEEAWKKELAEWQVYGNMDLDPLEE
ncbi:Cytochrome P450 monooxygenase patH [Colletotrichum viniferum]|nr:Cytochrome P450 monooxygenase patH [Colletotrichum viniferum]